MHASKGNICDILGTCANQVKLRRAPEENGWALKGFLSRASLTDLNNHFHIYMNKKGELVVLTPGRLNKKDKQTA